MGYVLVTPPDVEPIDLDAAKRHCREDTTELDAQFTAWIAAARQHFERQTNRSLITQEWRLDLDGFPCGPLRVGRGPIQSIDVISYVDTAGDVQSLTLADYIIDLSGDTARITPAVGEIWPCTYRRPAAVSVEYTAGHGDDAADVPELIRQGLLLMIGHWNANREAVIVAGGAVTVASLPMAAQSIIDSYWNPELG